MCMATVSLSQEILTKSTPDIEIIGTNTVHLGKVTREAFKLVKFTLRNSSEAPVKITGLKSTCPCIRGFPETLDLAPKNEGTVTLELNPNLVKGEFKRMIWILADETPGFKSIPLTLTGEVISPFDGVPTETVTFLQRDLDMPWTTQMTFTATAPDTFLGQPTVKRAIHLETDRKANVSIEVTTNKTELASYDIKLTVLPLVRGRITESIIFPVHYKSAAFNMEIDIQARIGTSLNLVPRQILLYPSEKTLRSTFQLFRSDRIALDTSLLKLADAPDGVTFEVVPPESSNQTSQSTRKTISGRTSRSSLTATPVSFWISITPEAAKNLRNEKEPKLSLTYPDFKDTEIEIKIR